MEKRALDPLELFGDLKGKTEIEVRRRRLPFTMVENVVIEDRRLTCQDKIVFVVLAKHADFDNGTCFPSLSLISKEAGASRRGVVNTLKKLVKYDYLTVKRRKTEKGDYSSNLYTLTGGVVHHMHYPSAPHALGGSAPGTLERYPVFNEIQLTTTPVVVSSALKNPETTPPYAEFQERYGKTVPKGLEKKYSAPDLEKCLNYMLHLPEEQVEKPLAYLQTLLKREKENPSTVPDYAEEKKERGKRETVETKRLLREAEQKKPSDEEIAFNRQHYENYKRIVNGQAAQEEEDRRQRAIMTTAKKEGNRAAELQRQRKAAEELLRREAAEKPQAVAY